MCSAEGDGLKENAVIVMRKGRTRTTMCVWCYCNAMGDVRRCEVTATGYSTVGSSSISLRQLCLAWNNRIVLLFLNESHPTLHHTRRVASIPSLKHPRHGNRVTISLESLPRLLSPKLDLNNHGCKGAPFRRRSKRSKPLRLTRVAAKPMGLRRLGRLVRR